MHSALRSVLILQWKALTAQCYMDHPPVESVFHQGWLPYSSHKQYYSSMWTAGGVLAYKPERPHVCPCIIVGPPVREAGRYGGQNGKAMGDSNRADLVQEGGQVLWQWQLSNPNPLPRPNPAAQIILLVQVHIDLFIDILTLLEKSPIWEISSFTFK